jgi:hypothetical protein
MTQVIEHLPNKCEALFTNPSNGKKRKEKREKEREREREREKKETNTFN